MFKIVDGTHPHQWSPRKNLPVYPFQSADATQTLPLASESTGVENYITHNGDFEFYRFANNKYYDTSEIQDFLVKALGVPMPATVDSAAVAGMIDLLRCQGCWALSSRYSLCLALESVDPADKMVEYPCIDEYVEIGKVLEKAFSEFIINHQIKSVEDISSSPEQRSMLEDSIMPVITNYLAHINATSRITGIISTDQEAGNVTSFIRATVNAFFDNDLLHCTRTFLENAKGSFGLSVSSSLDAHRQGEYENFF
jgi:hypothetical protein